MSSTRTIPRDKKDINVVDVINMIQEIPKAILQTPQGVALISLLSGIMLEQAGLSELVFKIKKDAFLDDATKEKVAAFPSENAFCLSLGAGRNTICELKPKLNVAFDIFPWEGTILGIRPDFGKIDIPVPKLLIALGSMGLSAEFLKGLGGIIPG